MHDLFNGAAHPSAISEIEEFKWIVAVFSADGASITIRRANEHDLKTFYPIRFSGKGEPTPMWANYLFIEFVEGITIDLCRITSKFMRIVSARDKEGIVRPILVPKNAIAESLRMVTMGKFDEKQFKRQFHGRGSIVRVIEGNFIDRKVRLEMDVTPDMNGRTRVPVDINGIKAKIEIFKLAL